MLRGCGGKELWCALAEQLGALDPETRAPRHPASSECLAGRSWCDPRLCGWFCFRIADVVVLIVIILPAAASVCKISLFFCDGTCVQSYRWFGTFLFHSLQNPAPAGTASTTHSAAFAAKIVVGAHLWHSELQSAHQQAGDRVSRQGGGLPGRIVRWVLRALQTLRDSCPTSSNMLRDR